MRIVIVGAAGDVGKAAMEALAPRHEIVTAGRASGDIRFDMTDLASVKTMYDQAGTVDAVVATAGSVHFGPLETLTEQDLMFGLKSKLMGQVNLVLAGMPVLNDGGSFTLTGGIINRDPIELGTGAATANGALEGFAAAAAIELPRGLRVNIVSPGLLQSSVPRYGEMFPGHEPVSPQSVGAAYARSVEGTMTGETILVH